MIQMSEGFKLYKNEPLDSRMQFNSMAEMKATEDFKLYDGCFATIANDPNKITYQWWSSNPIHSVYGKWRPMSEMMGTAANMTEEVVSSIKVGGIEPLTIFPNGTDLTYFVKKLIHPEVVPNIEYTLFTGDGKNACAPGYYPEGTVMLAGGTYSITILDTPGATCEITHVEFYKRGVLFDTIRKEDIIDYHGVFGYSYDDGAFSTDTHFEAKVYYVDSYGIVGVVDIHDDYKFVIPNYYGILDSENDITIAKLSTLDVVALPTREFTWTGITTRSQIPCYCYPTSMKPLESIKDGNGYEMISSFSRVIAKVNSKDNYYVYYFTGGTTVDDFTFIFK